MTIRERKLLQLFFNDLSKFEELHTSDELSLIKKAQGGDNGAACKLIEHSFGKALQYTLHLMKEHFEEINLDNAHDVTLKAIQRAIEKFNSTKYDKLIPFVKHIIKQRIIDILRRKGRWIVFRLTKEAFSVAEVQPEDYDVLKQCIECLPKRTKEILAWHFKLDGYKDVSEQEIADEYSLTVSRVQAIIREGIASLRSYEGLLRSA